MSQYYIDGPVQVGTVSTITTIKGDVVFADTTTSAGDILYANGSNTLTRLAITNNGVMIGTATAPYWLPIGSNNQVLTVVSGSPAWAAPQADASQYGFMVFKNLVQGPITTAAVLSDWDAPTYTDPEYDSTGGDFVPSTGIFTVPGTTSDKTRWEVNVGVTFTQSSNNNNLSTDYHLARVLLNGSPIAQARIYPAPRNNNLSTLLAPIDVNFEAKGTDQVTVDIACNNGGNITVRNGSVTWFGLMKLANA